MDKKMTDGNSGNDNDSTTASQIDIKCVEPSIHVHTFSDKIMDTDVYFHVTKLSDSFYLWMGSRGKFGDLSVAMRTVDMQPSGTVIMGGTSSHTCAVAQRLSKRTGKQVFVGGDLAGFDQLHLPLLEKRVVEEMKAQPECF